jgi:hypothetical protein
MPNWSYTNCTLTGPEADIEAFKKACLFEVPEPGDHGPDNNGIDFQRIIPMPDEVRDSAKGVEQPALWWTGEVEKPLWYTWSCDNWGTKWPPRQSDYWVEDGQHMLYTITAWAPPIPVFEKIVAMFPTIAIALTSFDECGNYFYKGTISAGRTDIVKDEDAERRWEEIMSGAPHISIGDIPLYTKGPAER